MSKNITVKRRLSWLLGISATLLGGVANAQVLITENFSTNPPAGWNVNNISGTAVTWKFNNPGSRSVTGGSPGFDANFAILDSDNQGSSSVSGEDAALESPAFDASQAGSYVLEFDNQYRAVAASSEGAPTVEVWNGTTWNPVLTYPPVSDGYPSPGNHKTIDITTATGGSLTARVRFHWVNGSWDYWWAVDNVIVKRINCTPPAATFTFAPDCANNQFSINVNLTSLGSATSVGISDGTNSYGPATAPGTYVAGPYPTGSSKVITLTHNTNSLCNIVSPAQLYNCPPVNDECINATAFPVIPTDGTCVSMTANTLNATQSLIGCVGTADDDVWYSFVCPAGITKVYFANTTVSGGTDRVIEFFSGTCANLTSILCSDPESGSVTGLTPGATYYFRIFTYGSGNSTQVSVCLKTDPPMSYSTSVTEQPTTTAVVLGAANQNIIRVNVKTTGVNSPLSLTQLDFNTSGSTSPANILNAKVYYTGTSTTFSTTTPFGNAVVSPNGTFSVTGSQALGGSSSGTANNYFFLAYDVACNAPVGNVLDAQCTGLVVGGVSQTPTATDPSGNRAISNIAVYTATTATSTTVGAAALAMGRTGITGNSCANTVTQVKFNTSTSVPADISQAKCYYTTSTTFGTANQFGSAVVSPNGLITFTGSQALAAGPDNYFWLAYDVSCSATVADSLIAVPVSITADGTEVTVTVPGTNAKKGIAAVAVPSYTATTSTNVVAGTAALSIGRANITGSLCANAVTQVKFNTGTSVAADIAQAKCYYTTSTTFSTTTPFGTAVISPSGDITFTGSQALAAGTGNYFWLAYDISCTAVVADSVVAIPVNIIADGTTYTLATPASNPKKGITAATAPSYTATTTTSVAAGTASFSIGRTNIIGNVCNNTVTQVKFNTGSSPVADLASARCYYTTSTTFSTANPFGSVVTNPAGEVVFNGSQALAAGSGNYFWLAYDVSCSAVLQDSLQGIPVNITSDGNVITIATPATNAKKGVTAFSNYVTIADGNWNSASTWLCGAPPASGSNVVVNHNVTVNSAGNVAANVTVNSGKTLTISSGDLTMGATGGDKKVFTNNGTLNVSGGIFNINGNMTSPSGSAFIQSGGNINIDGNAGGVTANSVSSGTYLLNIGTSNLTWSGGTITMVDPHAASGTNYCLYFNGADSNVEVSNAHTFVFGNGVSADAAASTNGFYVNNYVGSYRLNLGKVVINGPSASGNRYVTSNYSFAVKSDLVIDNGGELRLTSYNLYVGGNITVNAGSTLTTSSATLAAFSGTSTTNPATIPQTISGDGIFRNAVSGATANFSSLTINNTSADGVTFGNANSLLSGSNTGTVSGTFTLTAGTINVGSNALVLGTSPSSAGSYSYTGGMVSGKFKRWIGAATGTNSFDIGNASGSKKVVINFTTAPTAAGSLTAVWNAVNPGNNGLPLTEGGNTYTNVSSIGYWTVTAGDGLTGGTYTASFIGTGINDVSDYNAIAIAKRATASDPWALVGVQVAPTGTNANFVLTRTGMTGFSDFAIININVPLAIKLASFTGYNKGAVNVLDWTTASEENAVTFEVMRSADGKRFEKIGEVEASNKVTGSKYTFTDEQPLDGRNLYKLNMVDRKGDATASTVVELNTHTGAAVSINVHPNPVTSVMHITIAGKPDGKALIVILDMFGKTLQTIAPNSSDVSVDMSRMSAGTYFVKFIDNSHTVVSKIVKN